MRTVRLPLLLFLTLFLPGKSTTAETSPGGANKNLFIPRDFSQKHSSALIVSVDGISSLRQFSPHLGEATKYLGFTGYLKESLEKSQNIKNVGAEIKPFSWSGVIQDTPQVVDALVATLEHRLKVAKENKRPFAIISHSWGGVLSYLALKKLERERRINPNDVDLLITIHTPLNDPLVKNMFVKGELQKPVSVTRWVNYFSDSDALSSEMPAMIARNSNTGKSHSGSHQDIDQLDVYGVDIANAVIRHDREMAAAAAGGIAATQSQEGVGESGARPAEPVVSPPAGSPVVSTDPIPERGRVEGVLKTGTFQCPAEVTFTRVRESIFKGELATIEIDGRQICSPMRLYFFFSTTSLSDRGAVYQEGRGWALSASLQSGTLIGDLDITRGKSGGVGSEKILEGSLDLVFKGRTKGAGVSGSVGFKTENGRNIQGALEGVFSPSSSR